MLLLVSYCTPGFFVSRSLSTSLRLSLSHTHPLSRATRMLNHGRTDICQRSGRSEKRYSGCQGRGCSAWDDGGETGGTTPGFQEGRIHNGRQLESGRQSGWNAIDRHLVAAYLVPGKGMIGGTVERYVRRLLVIIASCVATLARCVSGGSLGVFFATPAARSHHTWLTYRSLVQLLRKTCLVFVGGILDASMADVVLHPYPTL